MPLKQSHSCSHLYFSSMSWLSRSKLHFMQTIKHPKFQRCFHINYRSIQLQEPTRHINYTNSKAIPKTLKELTQNPSIQIIKNPLEYQEYPNSKPGCIQLVLEHQFIIVEGISQLPKTIATCQNSIDHLGRSLCSKSVEVHQD